MSSAREMRLRIRSIKNIGQVTRALQAVAASRVKKATAAAAATEPYAAKAWQVLVHLAEQPGHDSLHPLLSEHKEIKNVLVVVITSDRGLAGASNVNVVRETLQKFRANEHPISYVTVGRKGRDMLVRRRRNVIAEFSKLPSPPTFLDTSAIGHLVVEEFLEGHYDEVYLAYNKFINMIIQKPVVRRVLPLQFDEESSTDLAFQPPPLKTSSVFAYEPGQNEILDEIVPRFTALQIYQSILSAQASEHAARMIAMRNATDNANELAGLLQLEYNKARQQSITNDLLDIAGGAEALAQVEKV
jgi:F-type H+-transporting ATPase subunit gamma